MLRFFVAGITHQTMKTGVSVGTNFRMMMSSAVPKMKGFVHPGKYLLIFAVEAKIYHENPRRYRQYRQERL